MAHLKKFTMSSAVRMTNHYERSSDDGIQRANENIKPEKTNLNYNLAPNRDMCGATYLKNVLKEVYVYAGGRADTKVMCDCVVTAPKDLAPERYRRFFSVVYNFLADRYGVDGRKNIISAYVHMDETTPHIHFSFVPLASAKPKQAAKGYKHRLCAKEVVSRRDLQTLHTDMQEIVSLYMGHDVHVITGGTVVNKPMYEFKREKLQESISRLIQAQRELSMENEIECRPLEKFPAYRKGTLGLATEDKRLCSVPVRDLLAVERKIKILEKEKAGLQKLDQLANVLYGGLKEELETERKLNRELTHNAQKADSLARRVRELEKAVRVAWQLMPPHLERAYRVSLEDGEGISRESVLELAETFRKALTSSQQYLQR